MVTLSVIYMLFNAVHTCPTSLTRLFFASCAYLGNYVTRWRLSIWHRNHPLLLPSMMSANPYVKGAKLTVTERHPPPPPEDPDRFLLPDDIDETQSPLTRCVNNPPTTGTPGSETLRLNVVDTLRTGNDRLSQVVMVHLLSGPRFGVCAVAKFYDPLYFLDNDEDLDPFGTVDVRYSRESAIYRHLEARGQPCIASFWGSYSTDIPLGLGAFRTVRLILLGYTPGVYMNLLQPADFSQVIRKSLMKAIINAETQLYKRDICFMDLHPRNILVQGLIGHTTPNPQITFINFTNADMGRSWTSEDPTVEAEFLPGTYISPILRWGHDRVHPFTSYFEGWIDWEWDAWLEKEYRHDVGGITDYMEQLWRRNPEDEGHAREIDLDTFESPRS